MKNSHRLIQIFIVLMILVICFTGIFDRALWTPDEPRVAAMALEMSKTGQHIVPHLAGIPFVEKPPLYYAVAGILIKLLGCFFGVTGAVRLSTVLWGLGVLFFTGLISRRLLGRKTTILTVAILASMAGFVENFHWIRVDAALAFFVIAAIFGLIEGFTTQRSGFYIFSGVASAGAFLTKGFIGPLLVIIPFIGLMISRKLHQGILFRSKREIWAILTGAFLFVTISLIWIAQFKHHTDSATWYEWFHVNQLGRFTGEASTKGHMHPNSPFYYLKTIAIYGMPWTPFVFSWCYKSLTHLKSLLVEDRKHELFLLIWGCGVCILLSIPVTKRDIYLIPALPAFALMASAFIDHTLSRWTRTYTWFIMILCFVLLAIFASLPWITPLVSGLFPQNSLPFTIEWTYRNGLCLIALIFTAGLARSFYKNRMTIPVCIFLCSAMLFTGTFLVPLHHVDQAKDLEPGIIDFLEKVPNDERCRIAGWNFSQTMLGAFYIYGDWKVSQVQSRERLDQIVRGNDKQFDSIIMNQVYSIPELIKEPYELLLEGHPRGARKYQYRGLYWIKGVR